MSFGSFFCNRYNEMLNELEKAYYEVKVKGGSKHIDATVLDVKIKKIGNDMFLIFEEIEKAFELSEKNLGRVATKILQGMWDLGKKQ